MGVLMKFEPSLQLQTRTTPGAPRSFSPKQSSLDHGLDLHYKSDENPSIDQPLHELDDLLRQTSYCMDN